MHRPLMLFAILWPFVSGDPIKTNHFINPVPYGAGYSDASNNPVFSIGSKVQIQWSTNWTGYSLGLGQLDKGSMLFFYDDAGTTNLSWPASLYDMMLSDGNIFYFRISNNAEDEQVFDSHDFNLTNVTTTTSSLSSMSSISTSTTTLSPSGLLTLPPTSANAVNVHTITSSTQPSANSTSNNHTALKVGVGVGVGVGVLAMLTGLGLGWLFFRRRGRAANNSAPLPHQEPQDQKYASSNMLSAYSSPGTGEDTKYSRLSFSNPPNYSNQPLELHHERPPAELPP